MERHHNLIFFFIRCYFFSAQLAGCKVFREHKYFIIAKRATNNDQLSTYHCTSTTYRQWVRHSKVYSEPERARFPKDLNVEKQTSLYQLARTAIIECQVWVVSTIENLSSRSSGNQKSEIQVTAGLVLPRSCEEKHLSQYPLACWQSLRGLSWLTQHPISTCVFPSHPRFMCACAWKSPFDKDTSQIRVEARRTPHDFILTECVCNGPISQWTVFWGTGYQDFDVGILEGHNAMHNNL